MASFAWGGRGPLVPQVTVAVPPGFWTWWLSGLLPDLLPSALAVAPSWSSSSCHRGDRPEPVQNSSGVCRGYETTKPACLTAPLHG